MHVDQLNFHHLRYFWAVATEGNLTRAATRMRVAQSALSSQIQQLEAQFEVALFKRVGRRLELTEGGRLVLGYAEEIFGVGRQLAATLDHGRADTEVLRLGAVATLSRNFQESFVKPLLEQPGLKLSLESGGLSGLLVRLEDHAIDLVLANRPPSREPGRHFRCRRIARQPVSLVGSARRRAFTFPHGIGETPMILPGPESDIRTEFDALCEQLGLQVRVLAEVDDMATMRLLARDTNAIALLPSVVVRDELRQGLLQEYCVVPGLFETFYAITVERSFQHPLVKKLLARDEAELLSMQPQRSGRPGRAQP